MHSEFKIIPYIDEQYIITTGSQCYLSFLKIICAATLICCDVPPLSPQVLQGRHRWTSRKLRWKTKMNPPPLPRPKKIRNTS